MNILVAMVRLSCALVHEHSINQIDSGFCSSSGDRPFHFYHLLLLFTDTTRYSVSDVLVFLKLVRYKEIMAIHLGS